MATPKTFSTERERQALVVVPLVNIGGLAEEAVRPELDRLLEQLQAAGVRNVIIDFARISYFGTTMLEVIQAIGKQIRQVRGKMALCNLSDMQHEVLHVAGFDTLWPICPSRQEALDAVGP